MPSAVALQSRTAFLWAYLDKRRADLVVGVASMVARDGMAFAIPLLIREGVDSLTHPRPRFSISAVALAMIAVALPRSGFQALARLKLMGTSREVEYAMRRDFLAHLFRLDLSFWGRTRVGDVMASATNDLNAVRMMLGPGVASLFESVVSLPVAFVVMSCLDWRLTFAAFATAPLAFLLMVRFGHIIRNRFEAIQAQFSKMSASVQQSVAGVRVVRAFVRESPELQRFETLNKHYSDANCVLALYSSSLDPLLSFLTGVSTFVVLLYGGHQVLSGKLDVGTFVLFTTYTAMLVRPISSLGRVVNLIQRGAASLGRLQSIFAEQPRIASAALRVQRSGCPAGALTYENVTVQFDSFIALDHIQLEVRPGSTIALMGVTGAGKSTLVRLLPRLLDPTEGRVLIGDVDVKQMDLAALRSLIGIVPQETFLFSATLAENIAFGSPLASDADGRRAAEIAGLANDIETFPAGYATVVGERGIMLSGGQKQRIAIARAILKDPRILILDDALSSVDSVTEQRILQQLKSIMSERTTFLISHRVATAQYADQIVVLEAGRIVDQGQHGSLLTRGGAYARLHHLQALEEELEVS